MSNTDLVLGTAGHIDHGKSSLICALTGTDPDRLAEEKKRGITIELGFARLDLPVGTSLGVVDVPGHERFVRQMISGATGIDLALICIAADDGIMPQTAEHLAVLELLGITNAVVALTKTDLVDEEWAAFMADEVKARLADTPFASAPIVPVSAHTEDGLDELRQVLAQAASRTERTKSGEGLRLPVDRVFTIKGAGTVITGTLWSGRAAVGDEVEVLPRGKRARVRSVQVHGKPVEAADAGQRVALNLVGLSTEEVRPGDFLAAPGTLRATDRFDADFTYLGAPNHPRPFESGARVHVAHGTREVTGRVLLADGAGALSRGQRAVAQVRLDEPLPVAWRDRFVVRSYSPVAVVGGGTVLRAHPKRTTNLSAATRALLDALRTEDHSAIAEAAFALEELPVGAPQLAEASGLTAAVCQHELDALAQAGRAVRLNADSGGATLFTTKSRLQKTRSAIGNELMKFHGENPSATGIAKEALRVRVLPKASPAQFDALLADALAQGVAIMTSGEISHPQAGAGAQAAARQAADALFALIEAAGPTPPDTETLIKESGLSSPAVHKALGALEREGRIVRMNGDIAFAAEALNAMERALRNRLAEGPANAAALKEAMGTSRKYAIPLLEHFDELGLTRREGDMRILC